MMKRSDNDKSPTKNWLCSINNVPENFAYDSSTNQYRTHHNISISPIYDEVESDICDHYTEIPFHDEKIID